MVWVATLPEAQGGLESLCLKDGLYPSLFFRQLNLAASRPFLCMGCGEYALQYVPFCGQPRPPSHPAVAHNTNERIIQESENQQSRLATQ